jgi:unsaturated pyranuronate lyase
MKTALLFSPQKVETSTGIHMSGFAGEQLMTTHLLFEAGAIGASHAHPHEQLTVVLRGEMEFTLGEERKVLKAGEALSIPSNVIHGARALTEAEVLDIFTPVRVDLLEKLLLE